MFLPYSNEEEYEALLADQVRIEDAAAHNALLRGLQQIQDAVQQGRVDELPIGRRLLAAAYESLYPEIVTLCAREKCRGIFGKYMALIRRVQPDVITAVVLRQLINMAIKGYHQPLEARITNVLRGIGDAIEMEALVSDLEDFAPAYTDKTLRYLDTAFTKSVTHRRITLMHASANTGVDFEPWTAQEKIAVGRILCEQAFSTGLFRWAALSQSKGVPSYYLSVTEAVQQHLETLANDPHMHKSWVYPPCVIPPQPWENFWEGGYHTLGLTRRCTLMQIHGRKKAQRSWIMEQLKSPTAQPAINAANKAQSVPYRVNKRVLDVLGAAMAAGSGLLGLPRTLPMPKPQFPMMEGWVKAEATTEELDKFAAWKSVMGDWHTAEAVRRGQHCGLVGKLRELRTYKDYKCLYFPVFFDWRGRLYFRSALNPQSNDAVKGCLDFAEGKRLGTRGLYWLWVHIANCCGYDKHDNDLRMQWAKDNWECIQQFLDDPINVPAPEPSTAFTLLQAGWAMQEALELQNPEDYICHVPVAQDATCSGLQHFSAMLRDPVGATYTNLIDNGTDKKSDVYMKVAGEAQAMFLSKESDPVIQQYWEDKPISRSMAKRPVMTYVYGSTLKSTMDYVVADMLNAGYTPVLDDDGEVLYSMHKLSVGIGKALRSGVERTVPAAAEGMRYLQNLCRWAVEVDGFGHESHKELKWVNPVGIPVINWAEGVEVKQVQIKSMGVSKILTSMYTGIYDKRKACSAVAPNFIHSLDGAHLCKTINAAPCDILPIHDSFATHPCDVDAMRYTLVHEFHSMYSEDVLSLIDAGITIQSDKTLVRPALGTMNLDDVLVARFPFC